MTTIDAPPRRSGTRAAGFRHACPQYKKPCRKRYSYYFYFYTVGAAANLLQYRHARHQVGHLACDSAKTHINIKRRS